MNYESQTTHDPMVQFREWFDAAILSGESEPTAMSLATVTAYGTPNVRMLLLKGVDDRGFVFYTNLESTKSTELAANPAAALCFYWKVLKRQVRVTGRVEPVSDDEADEYFASRPRLSQIGAWASAQSRPMSDSFELERNCAAVALRFPIGAVPRPPHWSGYRLTPATIEFWQEKPFRCHERVRHARTAAGWDTQPIFP